MTKKDYTEKLNELHIDRQMCKCCGNEIFYRNTNIHYKKDGTYTICGKSYLTSKTVNNNTYYLQVCENCLSQHYQNCTGINKHFNVMCDSTKFAFNISDDDYYSARSRYAMSKENVIKKYGYLEGTEKWENYCKRQAETNTYEYKHRVYGMTANEFKEFNKSRAVTKRNLIKKYGENDGLDKWEEYLNKQKLTKSWDYMVKKFGEEKAREINKSKAITHENLIKKFGVELGNKKWNTYLEKFKCGYSYISQYIFKKFDTYLSDKYTTYYANKNYEFPIIGKNYSYKLDYYIKELNTCIEFNGGAFHGDPRIYKDDEHCNPFDKDITAKQLRENDEIRYKNLKDFHNINTIILWELDANDKDFDAKQFLIDNLNIKL